MKTKTNALAAIALAIASTRRAWRAARSRRNRDVAEAQRTVSGDQVHQRHRYAHRRRVRSRDGAKRRLRRWRWPALPVRAPLRHAHAERISPPPSSPRAMRPPTEARQVNFATLPLQDAVKMVKGDGSRLLAVFSDPRCPYCKALDEELAKLDNVTVYTFLLPWLGPESRPAAEALWADAVPDRANDTTVLDRNLKLASQLGLRGTPMLIASDGRVSEGARSAEALDAWLTLASSRSQRLARASTRSSHESHSNTFRFRRGGDRVCRRVRLRQHGRCRRYVRIQLQSTRRRQVRFRLRHLLQLGREQPAEPAPRRPRHAPGSGRRPEWRRSPGSEVLRRPST